MFTRRSLFPAAAATLAVTALPSVSLSDTKKPHVYLARIEDAGADGWLEAWRHSTDNSFLRFVVYSKDYEWPYEDRLAEMSYQYAWHRNAYKRPPDMSNV